MKKLLCRIGLHRWVYAHTITGCVRFKRKCKTCLKTQTKYEGYPTIFKVWFTEEEFAHIIEKERKNFEFINKKP